MGVNYPKVSPINLAVQQCNMSRRYKSVINKCTISNGKFTCVIDLKPSIHSCIYKVLIEYKTSDYSPKAWLLSPELEKVNGKYPHHIYGFDANRNGSPRLCVFYPGYNEWRKDMLISESFVPWILSWLNTYEYWLITGKWFYDESPSSITKKSH